MADVPLSHLSRPQLVHLLLRIVDLSAPPVVGLPSGSGVELYDARLDPWNGPDECQAAPSVPRDQGMPRFGLVLSEVTTVGYPKLACPLRMPYLGVCRGECGAPCILQRAGHTNHLCEIHKIP